MKIENIKFVWFALPIVILQFYAASEGLFFNETYNRDVPQLAAAIRGVDLVSLLIIVPFLVISFFLLRRGSKRGFLLWLGVLGIIAYNYIFACFNIRFSRLFPVYVSLSGLSVFALAGSAVQVEKDLFKESYHGTGALRIISGIFQSVLALLFYSVWGRDIILFLTTGELPRMLREWQVITSAVHVIDMTFLLPVFLWGGISVIRNKNAGFLLSGMNLVLIDILSVSLLVSAVFMHRDGFGLNTSRTAVYGVIAACSSVLTLLYYNSIRTRS